MPHKLVVFKDSVKHAKQYECDPARVAGRTLTVNDASVRWLGSQLSQPTTPTGTLGATKMNLGSGLLAPPALPKHDA